jgi:hypothetical protein
MRHVVSMLVVICLAVGTLSAATFRAPSDVELLDRAELVVVATVGKVASREAAGRMIYTDSLLHIDQVLKGKADNWTITVSEVGGFANGHGVAVPGSASYTTGNRVLAFLRQREDGTYYTAYMGLGKYRFVAHRAGDVLLRDEDGIEVDDHSAFAARPANEFVRYIRDGAPITAQRPRLIESDAVHIPATNGSAADYAMTGGGTPIRWDCPTNCTVSWRLGAPHAGSADTVLGVNRAMDAWTNEPNAWITLEILGVNNDTIPDNDDLNDIIFNSSATVDDQGHGGFCDAGVGCSFNYFNGPSDQHMFDGTLFYDLISTDIVIRPVNFTQSAFDGVLTHELGHGIGIDHAPGSGSIMSPSPASGATLRAYDQEAVAEMYGNGLPCSAPVITTTSGSGTIPSGNTRTLTVSATGSTPFSYQWYRGNSGDTSTPVGTNSKTYTTPPITSQTNFWVRLTNACGTADSNTITVNVQNETCTAVAITTHPQSQNVAPNSSVTLTVAVTGTGPFTYQWYRGALGDTSIPVGTNSSSFTTPALTSSTSYWVRASNGCGVANSTQANLTVSTVCAPATITSFPTTVTVALGDGATLNVSVAGDAPFTYQWYQGESGDTTTPVAGATGPSLAVGPFFASGNFKYWVKVANGCTTGVNSATAVISVECGGLLTPVLSAPSISHFSYGYDVQWLINNPTSVASYELQEALNADFTSGVRTFIVHDVNQHIEPHIEITTDTRFYYRVRAISSCNQSTTNYSVTTSTVITRPEAENSTGFSISVPDDASQVFTQDYLVPGFGEAATSGDLFSIATDAPWLTVFPTTGALSAGGTTVQLTINPSLLTIGSTTATFVVTRTQGSSKGGVASNATTAVSFPFTISKVTPVTPAPRDTNAPPGTLLVPAIAHADGIGTRFQSDVRIVNASTGEIEYELSYTPSMTNGTENGKKLNITIAGNETKGLDDIVKGWYGSGVLGEAGLGTLEIRPLNNASPTATFASSRTYAISATGTLGQFIPAIGLEKFIGNIAQDSLAKISLQQIANSNAFRTNLGFVEGAGSAVTLRLTLKDALNNPLKIVEKSLPAYGHEQTSFAAVFGNVPITDGRVEVEVISPGGKASAYASVLDNTTSDPLLVFPVQAQKVSAQHYVVPGVAELDNGPSSNFHTDMRVFNAAATPVTVSLSYFPQNGDSTPRPANVNLTLGPGEVKSLDNILPTVWGLARTGGAVAVDAPGAANLVLTARTFSRDAAGGTYGQFIPGVTATDGVGLGERALELLQLEQSAQYRTNLGLVEVTGNPVKVEVTGQTGNKLTARTEFTLAGNEFRQVGRIFEQMGFGSSVYTGRVSIRVIEGSGKIAGYGSVVDNRTVDPTYVPSQ